MIQHGPLSLDARTRHAVEDLKGRISERYPNATFELARASDDPGALHLLAIVDVEDPDEVGDLVIERVVELQAEEQIPIHVIPLRMPQRVTAELSG